MTDRERRIAELAAEDLEGWARELPLGSETRRDLQQTARAYRLAARGGARLRAVPDAAIDERVAGPRRAPTPSAGAPERSPLTEAAESLDSPPDSGA